jgi:hypothetical protein
VAVEKGDVFKAEDESDIYEIYGQKLPIFHVGGGGDVIFEPTSDTTSLSPPSPSTVFHQAIHKNIHTKLTTTLPLHYHY